MPTMRRAMPDASSEAAQTVRIGAPISPANAVAVMRRQLDGTPFSSDPATARVAAAMWNSARAPHGVSTSWGRHEYLREVCSTARW